VANAAKVKTDADAALATSKAALASAQLAYTNAATGLATA